MDVISHTDTQILPNTSHSSLTVHTLSTHVPLAHTFIDFIALSVYLSLQHIPLDQALHDLLRGEEGRRLMVHLSNI